ncbi:PstS family phosphate ABC transporter substrate-binding protein [Marinibactrum halimedae]|uniref:PstS family phosphate ABC transporter substrate-binding protein n=1 Tax=Marinibactrum halimedae TaxID=1444977 RepID=UPI0022B7D230|nr:PstS family phosphate ABC transporter substrate-binding protein [Marinibactrum halimedae]
MPLHINTITHQYLGGNVLKALCIAVVLFVGTSTSVSVWAARDYIEIVGSSTVYPFATVVAERFGRATPFKTPKVEATGSGGGIKLFCQGVGVGHPDIANSSRRIKAREWEDCRRNGVSDIVEVLIGYDGIIIGQAVDADPISLTQLDVYRALAKRVPNPNGNHSFVDNPYRTWAEVNPALPDQPIEVLGPPPTSGTRDAFVELVLEAGCDQVPWIAAMKSVDEDQHKALCHAVREDGHFVEAGENDNLIVQKLNANPKALGIFGFSFLDQNSDLIKGAMVEGHIPSFDTIANGDYPISRPLYFYVKKAHVGVIPGIKEYLMEFTSNKAWGDEGYLTDKGMIPLPPQRRTWVGTSVRSLEPMAL